MATRTDAQPTLTASDDANLVRLSGRVSGTPERRTLPSGDEVVAVRLVVRRPDGTVDTLPVRVGPAPPRGRRPREGQTGRRLLAAAAALQPDDRVEVEGCLRRRWWNAGTTRQSRIEVEAHQLTAR